MLPQLICHVKLLVGWGEAMVGGGGTSWSAAAAVRPLYEVAQFLQVALSSHDLLVDLRHPTCCALTKGQLPWPSISISAWHQMQRKLCLYHPHGLLLVGGTGGIGAGAGCAFSASSGA